MEQHLSWESILAIFGAIAIIGSGINMIASAVSPFKKMDERVTACENKVQQHEGFICNDKEAIEKLAEVCDDNRKMQLIMLNHTIDGNGIEKMKELRNQIQQKL